MDMFKKVWHCKKSNKWKNMILNWPPYIYKGKYRNHFFSNLIKMLCNQEKNGVIKLFSG